MGPFLTFLLLEALGVYVISASGELIILNSLKFWSDQDNFVYNLILLQNFLDNVSHLPSVFAIREVIRNYERVFVSRKEI